MNAKDIAVNKHHNTIFLPERGREVMRELWLIKTHSQVTEMSLIGKGGDVSKGI